MTNYSTDQIIEIIHQTNLEAVCNPTTGDCEEVAIALHRIFNADAFIGVYDEWDTSHAVHAAIKKNGTLIDGTGKTSKDSMMDYISYLRMNDFPDEINTPEKMKNYMDENNYCEFPTDKYDETMFNYHEPTVQKIESQITNTIQ